VRAVKGSSDFRADTAFCPNNGDQDVALNLHGLLLVMEERQRKKWLILLLGSLKKQRLTGGESAS